MWTYLRNDFLYLVYQRRNKTILVILYVVQMIEKEAASKKGFVIFLCDAVFDAGFA